MTTHLEMAAFLHSEEQIIQAIDVYHEALKSRKKQKKWRRPPFKVGLDELFKFSEKSLTLIKKRNLQCFEDVASWFELAMNGAEEIDRRFPQK